MAVRYFASSLLEVGLQNYSFNFNAINIVAKRNAFRLIIAMFFFPSLPSLPRLWEEACPSAFSSVWYRGSNFTSKLWLCETESRCMSP